MLQPKLLLLCLLFIAAGSLYGQKMRMPFPASAGRDSTHLPDPCATDIFLNGDRKNAAYKAAEARMNREILRAGRTLDATFLTLPVAFHIVDKDPSFFTDADVDKAIKELNDAFSKSGAFAGAAGVDTKIRFCLAKEDPVGGITTGITRTVSPFGHDLNPLIEDGRLKNLVQWDPTRFINIWYVRNMHLEVMARFQCGNWIRMYAGGYATMPPGGGPLDGIVVSGLGNLLTHEMGHYLGLYHTFEGLDCRNFNCATDGDRVCDTPPDASMNSSFSCASPDNSCLTDTLAGYTVDQPDPIRNFMDYGNDACHNEFTQGQADRMKAAINTQRPGLLVNKCAPPCNESILASFTRNNAHPLLNEAINFTNTTVGATRYEWLVNGVLSASSADYNTSFAAAGKFRVTLKAYNGGTCFSSFSHDVVVTCGVTARFYTDKRQIAAKAPIYLDSIKFTNASVGANTFRWLMSNDRGMAEQVISTASDFTYVFTNPGNYQVKLIATNGACSDTTLVYTIPVTDPSPDGALYISRVDCYQQTKVRVQFFVCNFGYQSIPKNTPITFYDKDPRLATAIKLGTFYTPDIIAGLCCSYLFTSILDIGYKGLNSLYGVLNDSGTVLPVVLPNTTFLEKEYANNITSYSGFAFKVSASPALSSLEWGDTLQLRAQAGPGIVSSYVWSTGRDLNCTNCQYPYLVADSGTIKQVVATSNLGCTDTANIVVQVPPYNDFTIDVTDVQCAKGDSLAVQFTIRNSFKRAVIPKGLTVAFYKGDPTGSVSAFLPQLFSVPDTVRAAQATFTTIVKSFGTGKIYGVVNDTTGKLPIVFPSHTFQEKQYGNNFGSFLYNGFTVTPAPATATLEWGDTLQLSAEAVPGTVASYTWSNAAHLSCTECQSPLLIADTTTRKRVVAKSALGCADTAFVSISVPPYNDFTVAVSEVQCARGDSLFVGFSINNSFKRGVLPKNLSVSFYKGDPKQPGAVLLQPVFTLKDTIFSKNATFSAFIEGMPAGNLYVVVNDSAKLLPVSFPATALLEKEYGNNVTPVTYKPEELQVRPADTTVFRKSSFPLQLNTTIYSPASTLWSSDRSIPLSCQACPSPFIAVYHNTVVKVQTENRYGCTLYGSSVIKVFPPDLQVSINETKCYTNDTALVTFTVCMYNGYDSVWKGIPVSFYDGDPANTVTTLLLPTFITQSVIADTCATYTTKIRAPKTNALVAVVNDRGNDRAVVPSKAVPETNDRNNADKSVYSPFTVSILPSDTAIDRLTSLQLVPKVHGGSVSSYLWQPTTYLTCSTCPSPWASPPHTMEFYLQARNEAFCTDTAVAIIRTFSQDGVYLPTAFTPNGDGRNDVFYVIAGKEVNTIKSFSVYNRWGQVVHAVQQVPANTPLYGWRGYLGGKEAPSEVYVYYLVVLLKDGKEKASKGTVTLIR